MSVIPDSSAYVARRVEPPSYPLEAQPEDAIASICACGSPPAVRMWRIPAVAPPHEPSRNFAVCSAALVGFSNAWS